MAVGLRLGSFRGNRGRRDAGYAGIGFVSHFWGGGTLDMQKLGSFRVFGSWGNPKPVVIGFVSHFWSSTGPPRGKLGSFRIIGGMAGVAGWRRYCKLGSFCVIEARGGGNWVGFE